MILDEFGTKFGNLNRYDNGDDIPDFLSIWSSSPINKDTIKDGNLQIDKPALSILAGTQFEVLAKFMAGINNNNGLLERFLYVYDDRPATPLDLFAEYDSSKMNFWNDAVKYLSILPYPGNTKYLEFTHDAKKIILNYDAELCKLINERNEGKYTKYREYAQRLALLVALLESIIDNSYININKIKESHAITGVALAEYYRQSLDVILLKTRIKNKPPKSLGSDKKTVLRDSLKFY